jgi:DNA-binding NarL/FixJ family response regulator
MSLESETTPLYCGRAAVPRSRQTDADNKQHRIFVLSDVRLYRESLVATLAQHARFAVLGASPNLNETLLRVVELAPDVVLLDMATVGGLAFARSICGILPSVKVVAFAVREIDTDILPCAEAGIASYVAPECSQDDLVRAIDHTLRGELYCSARMAAALFRHVGALATDRPTGPAGTSLTRREQEILALIERGMSNKEIGRTLHIGGSTVKNHVHNILEKLHLHRRGQAAAQFRVTRSNLGGGPPTVAEGHRASSLSA